jgi:hypothetical protein
MIVIFSSFFRFSISDLIVGSPKNPISARFSFSGVLALGTCVGFFLVHDARQGNLVNDVLLYFEKEYNGISDDFVD